MTHAEYADGLRQVADFLEAHPEIELPESTLNCYRLYNKEAVAVTARALSSGGRCAKVYEESIVLLKRVFGPIELCYLGSRSNVCERVQVGTKIEPEHIIPAQAEQFIPAQAEQFIPEREVQVYGWRCPSLLAPDEPVSA